MISWVLAIQWSHQRSERSDVYYFCVRISMTESANTSTSQGLTATEVSNIVKAGLAEALESFQSNISAEIKKQKKESEKALSRVESLKRSSEIQFRFKGNKTQFQFNEKVLKLTEEGEKLLSENPTGEEVKETLKEIKTEITKRNKLIRLADKSDAG